MKPVAAAFFCLVSTPVLAQSGPTIGVIPGHCSSLVVAGRDVGCTKGKSLVYAILGNGRTMLNIPSDAGPVVSFVAEKDAQPTPGSYFMYLSRVDIGTHATHSTTDVGGVCHVDMDDSAMFWRTAICQAQDSDGARYVFSFKGDGRPAKMIHQQ